MGGSERVLGLDLGTTSLKAAILDLDGRLIHAAAVPVETRRAPGGIVEQDPLAWTEALRGMLARMEAAGLLVGVAAIGMTSQVNTHVFVDAAGRPLGPAIVWQDGRAAAEAEALDARIAAEERLRWWGAPMGIDASHALARMAWMARARPEAWEATASVLLPKDFLLLALAAARVSDPLSNVGVVGPDGAYVPGLLDLLPGAAERLPPLAPAATVAGLVPLGPHGRKVPVAVGTMDAWAGFHGVGLATEGDAAWLSGTSEVLAVASERAMGEPGILVFPRSGGLRVHAGPTQSGGASVAWFCRAFGTTPEAMAAEVEAAGPNLRAPLFLPHLEGERAPLWDASARGAFLGVEAGMDRAALARGVFEGVALSARLLLQSLEASSGGRIASFLCGGGGFRSEAWNQIRADVLGRPLRRAAVPDAGVAGAAAIGAVAAGLQPDLSSALAAMVRHDRTYEPDPRRAARHDDLFALYRPAYEALRPMSRALAARTT